MGIPQIYRRATEAAIKSYNYTDIAEGTGVTKFYLFESKTSAATDYHLGTAVIYSATLTRAVAIGAPGTDDDFDLSVFNLSKSIKGTGIIQIPFSVWGGATGSTFYVICKIRKWDETTETEIASVQSQNVTAGGSAGNTGILNISITIPQTHFKKGETLRLTIEGYLAGTASEAVYGIDTKNRATTPTGGTMVATDGNMRIPFLLD